MKQLLYSILLFLLLSSFSFTTDVIYISPGLTLSFNSNSKFMIGWKLSVDYSEIDKNYYNIIVGKQFALGKYPPSPNELLYVEIQGGKFDNEAFALGGGAGISYFEDKFYPRVSASFGGCFFLNLDYTLFRNLVNGGIESVLPVPINKSIKDIIKIGD